MCDGAFRLGDAVVGMLQGFGYTGRWIWVHGSVTVAEREGSRDDGVCI